MTAAAVGGDVTPMPGDGALQRYDEDKDGVIQKLEYLEALDHYIAGDPDNNDERISKNTYLAVLDLYITGLGGG
jgi:Ca2+-binding EF-hand superfamily protein